MADPDRGTEGVEAGEGRPSALVGVLVGVGLFGGMMLAIYLVVSQQMGDGPLGPWLLAPGRRCLIAGPSDVWVYEFRDEGPTSSLGAASHRLVPGQPVAVVDDEGDPSDPLRQVRIRVLEPPAAGYVGYVRREDLDPQ